MHTAKIYYARRFGTKPSSDLKSTHSHVATILVADLDQAFITMQAENWSPNGELAKPSKQQA